MIALLDNVPGTRFSGLLFVLVVLTSATGANALVATQLKSCAPSGRLRGGSDQLMKGHSSLVMKTSSFQRSVAWLKESTLPQDVAIASFLYVLGKLTLALISGQKQSNRWLANWYVSRVQKMGGKWFFSIEFPMSPSLTIPNPSFSPPNLTARPSPTSLA
jgi:hypothetical protein